MMRELYPSDWQERKLTCLIDANWECAHCGVTYGTLKISRRTGILFPVLLHAAHKHDDIDNPQPELIALCPSCHMKYDRRHQDARRTSGPRRPGYEVITVKRLATELSYTGLFLLQDEENGRVSWECAGLQGEANDPLAALSAALHSLQEELREARAAQEQRDRRTGGAA